ncbi:MAG: hypothetical protein H7Y11_04630 [Armatimonadetes bacterium]|nr:hypothetical protein [Anaerolineae bacterium]
MMQKLVGKVGLALALMYLVTAPFNTKINAQDDGLNLPTELYTLLNEGVVQRYGLGAAGIASLTPDDAFVVDFGVAPDALWLAYRTEAGLTLSDLLTGEARSIEATSAGLPPFRGRGDTLAWSPDGAALAYTTEAGVRVYFPVSEAFFEIVISPLLHLTWSPDGLFLAAEAENNIWWIYRREGDTLVLTSALPSSVGFAWVGEGLLLFAPEAGGLALMDVSNGNAQSQLSDEGTLFRYPAVQGDGSVAIFGRSANETTLDPALSYLYRVTPGETVAVTQISDIPVDLSELRWAPGGTLLLALRGGVLALIDPASGQGFTLPTNGVVAYGWGALRPASVAALPMTATGYFLAPESSTGIIEPWRLANDGTQAVPVLFTEADVTAFAAAPDDATYAYHSAGQLWLLPAGVEAATPLLTVDAVQALHFNIAADTLIYAVDDTIYTLALPDGEPQILLTAYSQPQSAPNGETLLVRLGDGDLGLLVLATGEVKRLGAFVWGKWLTNGAILAYGALASGGDAGVYLADASGQAVPFYTPPSGIQAVDGALTPQNTIRLLLRRSTVGPAPLSSVEIPANGGAISDGGAVGYLGAPQFSPDGRFMVGYGSAAGTLVVYDVIARQAIALTQPPNVQAYQWLAFR